MQKKFLFLLIVLLVGMVLMSGCNKKSGQQSINTGNNQTSARNQASDDNHLNDEAINPSGEYSINELLTMHRPIKCSWAEHITNGGDVTNIIYLNGKKFYQDVTMGDIGHAYTISNGEYLYIWNNFTDVASKIKFSDMSSNTSVALATLEK